jgi:DNA-binding MarR family transcriptional regulator
MRPLGYWVKEIDRRIEAGFARLMADEELTRRHWQILTTLAQADTSRAELDTALAPFAPTVRAQVDDLIRRGWATEAETGPFLDLTAAGRMTEAETGPVLDLTAAGRATMAETGPVLRLTAAGRAAHDRVAERVRTFRARVTEGLSEQDYATLVTLLERVAGNLTPA